MARLELRGLAKRFGETVALNPLDLAVEAGEFLVLVGPSGCGKSTVLRLVAGLETPTAGEILVEGRRVNEQEPRERDVAMVFQNYALYPHMTVARNIAFPLRMARTGRRELRAQVREAAELLGIGELLHRKPSQLSGGQQQRVALARALVRKPALFLFDEPLSNVDAKLRGEMRAELQRLHARTGATMLYVTHDQVEAMTLGTRIAVLDQGTLQQVGRPLEVFQEPANRFVAGFLGAPPMNLVEGPGARALLPDGAEAAVTAGFRPHEARVLAAGEGGRAGEAVLESTVELVEELGHEVVVHARLGEQPLVLAAPSGAPLASRGELLRFGVPREAVHLFDARGARVAP